MSNGHRVVEGRKYGTDPIDFLKNWQSEHGIHSSGGVGSGGGKEEVENELTYRVMQTIKGSYAAIGPLQCESVCNVKKARPVCPVDVLDCALGCADRCEQGSNQVELKEKLCIEGCTLFCGVHPTEGAGGFAPPRGVHPA